MFYRVEFQIDDKLDRVERLDITFARQILYNKH